MAIEKILVANRSEIAIRVFRAANELGLKTVAIWAEEDKLSLHRFKSDEAYQVGKGPHLEKDMGPIESYLSIEEVIRVARLSGADAIHPGYGLLSESPEFVDACNAAGITFIGPKAATMRALGNKVSARNLAVKAGVPVVPATPPLPDDMDKIKECGFNLGKSQTISIPYIEECPIHYECKVVHKNDVLNSELDAKILKKHYSSGDLHRIYYGEILGVYREKT